MTNKNICKKKSCCKKFPKGGIIMWSGSIDDIPKGWLLCDGTYNTPNLKDTFIMGCGYHIIGSSGGSSSIQILPENLPPHNHTVAGEKTIGILREIGTMEPERLLFPELITITSISGDGPGTSTDIDITPIFFVLAYIMKK
jgi:hypothetical protein